MELHEKWREQKTWGENLWKDKWLTPGDKGSKQMRGGDKLRQQILFWQTSASDHFKQMTNGWEEVVDRWEVTNRWQEIMFWQISLPQPSQTGEKRVRGCDKQMRTNFDKPLSAAAAVVAPSSSFNHLHSLKSQPFLKCVRLGGRNYAHFNNWLESPKPGASISEETLINSLLSPSMAGSMHWTSKFRTLKWLQRRLMSAKTLQKTLAVFSTCLALESSHKWFRHRRDHFRWAAAGASECTVTCQWLLVCALLAQLRRREYTFQSRPLLVAALGQPCTVYSVAGVYTVPWGSHVQSVAARTKWWTGPQIKQPAKPLLLDFPSRLPPIEPVGWDAGKMGSKMRRRGLYSRSHVPLSHSPLAELQGLHWPPLLRF